MRATLSALIATIIMLVSAPAASAQTTVVGYWEGARAPGLNLTAVEATKTVIIARAFVPKGVDGSIRTWSPLTLRLKNGKEKVSDGRRLNDRVVTFRFRIGNLAKVAPAREKGTYFFYESTDGALVKIRLRRIIYGPDC